jgi:hypothetical protein
MSHGTNIYDNRQTIGQFPRAHAVPAEEGLSNRAIGLITLIFLSIVVLSLFIIFAPPLIALVGSIALVLSSVIIGVIIGTCKSSYLDSSSGITAEEINSLSYATARTTVAVGGAAVALGAARRAVQGGRRWHYRF